MFINNYIFFHRQVQDYARELAAQGSGAVVFDVIPTSDYLFRHTHPRARARFLTRSTRCSAPPARGGAAPSEAVGDSDRARPSPARCGGRRERGRGVGAAVGGMGGGVAGGRAGGVGGGEFREGGAKGGWVGE